MGFMHSCSTLEKRIDKAKLVMASNPNAFAELASTLYPSKTVYVKGKDSITVKTVLVKGDSIKCPDVINKNGDTVKGKMIKCPDAVIKYIDTSRVDTLKTGNPYREVFLANALIKSDKDLTKEKTLREEAENRSKKKNYWLGGLGLLMLMAVAAFFKFR